jgi:hypothetical protein
VDSRRPWRVSRGLDVERLGSGQIWLEWGGIVGTRRRVAMEGLSAEHPGFSTGVVVEGQREIDL